MTPLACALLTLFGGFALGFFFGWVAGSWPRGDE